MERYIHPDDYSIERDLENYKGYAIVITCDGDILLHLQAEKWTDDQINTMVAQINKYYGLGHKDGMNQKAGEIKKALNI